MKLNALSNFILLSCIFLFSSCELIGDIFQAGIWVGILIVVVIIGLILWLIGRSRR